MADMSAWDDAIAQAKWYGNGLAVEYIREVRGRGRKDPPKVSQLENEAIVIEWDHGDWKTVVTIHNGTFEVTQRPIENKGNHDAI